VPSFPKLVKIKQEFPGERVDNICDRVRREMNRMELAAKIKPGHRIAITGGSRGINRIPEILAQTAQVVRELGGEPFIVSAMGSHGGGTSHGQREVLASLGITPETVSCPVVCSSEVVKIGVTPTHRIDVYCAKEALEADGLIVVNRIKAHTAFRAPRESGLLKMMGIGLGRVPGANIIHSFGTEKMGQVILEMAGVVLERVKVLGGLAIIENGYEETQGLYGLKPGEIIEKEAALLVKANALMPRLPFEDIDLLIVDEMGKNFSGTGMDTNIIGRLRIAGVPEPSNPRIKRLVVLGLSEESHGNANGIGLADFTTRKVVNSIDYQVTYLNGLTTGFLQRVMIPIFMENDREAIQKALESLRLPEGEKARIVRIKNTLHLEKIAVSENMLQEVSSRPGLEIISKPQKLSFDAAGYIKKM